MRGTINNKQKKKTIIANLKTRALKLNRIMLEMFENDSSIRTVT